jgi:hypothetical protein
MLRTPKIIREAMLAVAFDPNWTGHWRVWRWLNEQYWGIAEGAD